MLASLTPLGFPGYYAGDDGTIYSERTPGASGWVALTAAPKSSTKPALVVQVQSETGRKYLSVARTILTAFGRPSPDGQRYQPRHLNGDRADCRLENLDWERRRNVTRRGRGAKPVTVSVVLTAAEHKRLRRGAREAGGTLADAVRGALLAAGLI